MLLALEVNDYIRWGTLGVAGLVALTALVVIAVGFAFSRQITNVKFTGNMVPIVRFWWDPEPNDVLETQRIIMPSTSPGTS